ncbi:hypothetical protein LINPERHAP1_LOCUS8095 [Linum perenne]
MLPLVFCLRLEAGSSQPRPIPVSSPSFVLCQHRSLAVPFFEVCR